MKFDLSTNILKDALSYEQQVDRLHDFHALNIPDHIEAIKILSNVSYYRLSGYGIGLKRKDDREKYKEGISIRTLARLYDFDSDFKNAFLHICEHIEIRLRDQIGQQLAMKYGAEGYMDKANFRSKTRKDGSDVYDSIINSFMQETIRQRNIPFVKHHQDKYGGHFPIWVALELFTFGNLVSLYDIMLPDDQDEIATLYHTRSKVLKSWMLAIVEVRNICAHYTRLYNMPLKQTPFLYKEHRKYRNRNINKVFPVILAIKRTAVGMKYWDSYHSDLIELMDEYKDVVNLSFIGFPQDWKVVLEEKNSV